MEEDNWKEFIDEYLNERQIMGGFHNAERLYSTPQYQAAIEYAEGARRKFKEEKAACKSEQAPTAGLTSSQKYDRRLGNNRSSAKASAVFQQVLKIEKVVALRALVDERRELETRHASELRELERLHEAKREYYEWITQMCEALEVPRPKFDAPLRDYKACVLALEEAYDRVKAVNRTLKHRIDGAASHADDKNSHESAEADSAHGEKAGDAHDGTKNAMAGLESDPTADME